MTQVIFWLLVVVGVGVEGYRYIQRRKRRARRRALWYKAYHQSLVEDLRKAAWQNGEEYSNPTFRPESLEGIDWQNMMKNVPEQPAPEGLHLPPSFFEPPPGEMTEEDKQKYGYGVL